MGCIELRCAIRVKHSDLKKNANTQEHKATISDVNHIAVGEKMSMSMTDAVREGIAFQKCVECVNRFCDNYNALTPNQKKLTLAMMRDIVR